MSEPPLLLPLSLEVETLSSSGCLGIIDGVPSSCSPLSLVRIRQSGMFHGPHTLSMLGAVLCMGGGMGDHELKEEIGRVYGEVKDTAEEFNTRGDLFSGSVIRGFLRVANQMATQGAV